MQTSEKEEHATITRNIENLKIAIISKNFENLKNRDYLEKSQNWDYVEKSRKSQRIAIISKNFENLKNRDYLEKSQKLRLCWKIAKKNLQKSFNIYLPGTGGPLWSYCVGLFRPEFLNPFANGFRSIFSLVICWFW